MTFWKDVGLSLRSSSVDSRWWDPRTGVLARFRIVKTQHPKSGALARFRIFRRLSPKGALPSVEMSPSWGP
eukprot:5659804-Pyramimonas_sp.AAC.1